MARNSKALLAKAREDKSRRARLEHERLSTAFNEAETDEARDAAAAAIEAFQEEQAQEEERKGQLKDARIAARQAKRDAGQSTTKRRIHWVDGGRDMVPGISRRGKEFFAAAEGNLVKCNREISRWETANAYDNVRGIKKGEILMVISEHYMGDNKKEVVDVMVGPDIVKGIPAGALRPLE